MLYENGHETKGIIVEKQKLFLLWWKQGSFLGSHKRFFDFKLLKFMMHCKKSFCKSTVKFYGDNVHFWWHEKGFLGEQEEEE